MKIAGLLIPFFLCVAVVSVQAQPTQEVTFGPYEYEAIPDHEDFASFHPRKAPQPGSLLLRAGDRLAICGDSITEQKMYSRLMETYLTACVPQLEVTVRQYGWSGEKTDGFLRRMEKDCLTFDPTVATLAYGMNDSRYRPFDVTNGQWYEDHYRAIVRKFKENDVRVVVGSPGCAGKIASWVKSKSGTLDQHNVHLCALRDIAMKVAEQEDVRFADIFWPMYQAQVFGPGQHNATEEKPYYVAGHDGIHPGWAGQVIMAWAMLRSLGLDGEIGTISVDLTAGKAQASEGHEVTGVDKGVVKINSTRYPVCVSGDLHDSNSMRSGTTLVSFHEDLNRLILKVKTSKSGNYRVTWGNTSHEYSSEELAAGVNLAAGFVENPFTGPFNKVFEAVGQKQAYETQQVKRAFHSKDANENFAAVVEKTEAIRKPLAEAVATSVEPVDHQIKIEAVE